MKSKFEKDIASLRTKLDKLNVSYVIYIRDEDPDIQDRQSAVMCKAGADTLIGGLTRLTYDIAEQLGASRKELLEVLSVLGPNPEEYGDDEVCSKGN